MSEFSIAKNSTGSGTITLSEKEASSKFFDSSSIENIYIAPYINYRCLILTWDGRPNGEAAYHKGEIDISVLGM